MMQGTLDMLILRTVLLAPAHGHTIAHAIEHTSEDVLQVEHGSLYPALHRLEQGGWIRGEWQQSAEARRVRCYQLTAGGRRQLATGKTNWKRVVQAMDQVLEST